MPESIQYVHLFSGSEIEVIPLKEILEDANIPVLVKNEWESARLAGFGLGTIDNVHLHVKSTDFLQAQNILKEYHQA